MTDVYDICGERFISIAPEEPDACEYCGKVAPLRPYGKDGARICFECGMKNEPTTRAMCNKRFFE